MNRPDAIAALAHMLARVDPQTSELADIVTLNMEIPGVPMLMRVRALALVIAGVSEGLASLVVEDGADSLGKVHMSDTLPDIILTLRCAADLLEDANKARRN